MSIKGMNLGVAATVMGGGGGIPLWAHKLQLFITGFRRDLYPWEDKQDPGPVLSQVK